MTTFINFCCCCKHVHINVYTLFSQANVENIDRFYDEFSMEEEDDSEDKNELKQKSQKSSKPSDFQILFGGNKDDDFSVGIKFTR